MYFAVATVETFMTRIMIIEEMTAGEAKTSKETGLFTELDEAMAYLNHTFSKNKFLVADQFTAADICVSYQLYWCTLWPELNVIIEKYPNVTSYLNRMKQMPSAIQSKVFTYEG